LLLIFGHTDLLNSISLAFATLTSGGFVPTATVLTLENPITLIVIMGGMIIAALPFAFHFGIFSKEVEATKEVKEILIYITLIISAVFLFMFIETSFSEKEWLSTVFHIVSASTTTGFQCIDLSLLSVTDKILLIVLMLIGGTAFSTAGGIKIARLMLIVEKIINNKKHKSMLINKNHVTIPSFISATAIQFRRKIKPISNLSISEEK